jgi:hypothetical protein
MYHCGNFVVDFSTKIHLEKWLEIILPFYWLQFNLKQHGSVPDMERMGTFAEKFVAKLEYFYVTNTKNYMLNMLYNRGGQLSSWPAAASSFVLSEKIV